MPGLEAFTQAHGSHSLYETKAAHGWGQWFGWTGYETIGYSTYETARSDKWYPTPSDHVRPTTYARAVRKLTKDVPSTMYRYQTEGNPPNDYVVISYYSEDYIPTHHPMGSYVVIDPQYDNAHAKSVDDALNRLTARYAGIGADLGQARKTCDEFSRLVIRLAKGLLALKRGDPRQAYWYLIGLQGRNLRDYEKTIADLWLSWIYGIKPLLHDIYDAQQAVHDVLKKPVHILATGHAESPGGTLDNLYSNGFYHSGYNRSSHRTRLGAKVVNPLLYLLNEAGLINPLSIAWELVPWSFVIDWFVPVGNTLQAITAGVGLEEDGGYTSSIAEDQLEIRRAVDPPGWSTHCIEGGFYQEKGYTFRRQAYASFPLPELYADVTPYSTPRAINALALIRQLV